MSRQRKFGLRPREWCAERQQLVDRLTQVRLNLLRTAVSVVGEHAQAQ
jgi:hypothetical protein